MKGLPSRVLLALLGAYRRWVSPLVGPHCRFHPSCSSYAMTAITEHGALAGSWLALKRVARCQPFSAGGHDPVPTSTRRRSPTASAPAHPRGAQL